MKAFSESSPALAGQAGLILLLTEKSAASARHARCAVLPARPWRAQPDRYPDFGLWTSLPPSRCWWATSGCGSL